MLAKCLAFSFLISASSMATTIVVRDYGNSVDIGEYYSKSKPVEKEPYTKEQIKKDINATFPLKSTLRLGKVYKKNTMVKLPASIALVGTDQVSKKWLQTQVDYIKSIGAMVIVIDCNSLSEYKRFQSALMRSGIRVAHSKSVPFEEITDAYPVIITNGKLIQ